MKMASSAFVYCASSYQFCIFGCLQRACGMLAGPTMAACERFFIEVKGVRCSRT
jgi:hypothetical protein